MGIALAKEYTMTIGGKAAPTESTFEVINPSSAEVFAEAPICTSAQLDAAMDAAAQAYPGWRNDEITRRETLNACAGELESRSEELAQILTREQGKPLARSRAEIASGVKWLRYTATLEIPVEVLSDSNRRRVEVRHRPLGVVAAITPWNYPVSLAVWKIAPALLAGNTMVIKPSPFTPLSTVKLGEIFRNIIPAGVLNVISGGDQLGACMTKHSAVRKISFTGSVDTGKLVAAAAAPDLKRVTLELGGNDAAIVLPDADPQKVAQKIFWGAFENCGQVCSAIKRLYVPESLHSSLVAELIQIAEGVKVGDGLDPKTQLGPINNRPQFDRVNELVENAKQNGASIRSGGRPLKGPGFFYEPTIISDVADATRLVKEEQFGPVLPVLSYGDVDEAIERANATHYGLSGSVWSADTKRAKEVASRLECGTVWVNQHLVVLPSAPFGGSKWSGIGVENGHWGLLGFTELQTVNIAK